MDSLNCTFEQSLGLFIIYDFDYPIGSGETEEEAWQSAREYFLLSIENVNARIQGIQSKIQELQGEDQCN